MKDVLEVNEYYMKKVSILMNEVDTWKKKSEKEQEMKRLELAKKRKERKSLQE